MAQVRKNWTHTLENRNRDPAASGQHRKALTISPPEHGDALRERPANGHRNDRGFGWGHFLEWGWRVYTVRERALLHNRLRPAEPHPQGQQQGPASPRQPARRCPAPLTPRKAHSGHQRNQGWQASAEGGWDQDKTSTQQSSHRPAPPPLTAPGSTCEDRK